MGSLNKKSLIGQLKINDELKNHNHPKSRNLTSKEGKVKKRTTDEEKEELINHYRFAHNLT